MADLTTIILTFNEEKNIRECIQSVKGISKRIIVVDSFSTDKTVEIARKLGAEIISHEFVNQAQQFIYGTEVADIKTKWILRLDADERLTRLSANEIQNICNKNEDTEINGIIVRFAVNFMGKNLKHGGIYPFRKLIVYKRGKGRMEHRNMDEHIVLLKGKAVELKHDSIHKDYKDLTAWINKHNKYSSREVLDYFNSTNVNTYNEKLNGKAKLKRFIKFHLYYKLPIGTRAHLYYLYRYYFKLGFLDGKEGKIFAFLQAYWYRYLVDAKIYEADLSRKNEI